MSWHKRTIWLLFAFLMALVPAHKAASVADDTRQIIRVNRYEFDPLRDGEPPLPAFLHAPTNENGLYLTQFVGPIRDTWLTQLQESGWRVLQYYPHYTYLLWQDGRAAPLAGRFDFVRWQGRYHPAYKISPDLARPSALTDADGRIRQVDVMVYDDGHLPETLTALQRLGAELVQVFPAQPDRAFYDAIVVMPASALSTAARLPAVLWLGYASPRPQLEDEASDQIVAGNVADGAPWPGYGDWLGNVGYDGDGVTWAVIDTGVDYDHPDLSGRIGGGYSFAGACDPPGQPGSDCEGGGHGTLIAGILAADATTHLTDNDGYLYGLGIAPAASLFAMNPLSGDSWPPAGGWQENSKRALLGGAIGGNNSWTTGEGLHHGYQTSERIHDLMVRDGNFDTLDAAEPFIEVFSAGNYGNNGVTAPKEAKNLIVIGSSVSFRAGNIDDISNFSSRGPATDGRILPTVVAPGDIIASTRDDSGSFCDTPIPGTNGLYALCSGTSFAAPHASGAIALLAQWWRAQHDGATPSPAMSKALLVNSAEDLGTPDIPNAGEGWGRINLAPLLSPTVPILTFDQETILDDSGAVWQLDVRVVDPTQPLKITLAWSDAAAAPGANPALVNNLDLIVLSGGITYRGNNFAAGWSISDGPADTLNNLENVFLPQPGTTAVITVRGANIAGDGVPYNGDLTDQDFALVCTNCAPLLTVTPARLDVCAPAVAAYAVALGQVPNYADPVWLEVSGAPVGATASLDQNPLPPGSTTTLHVTSTDQAVEGLYTLTLTAAISNTNRSRSVRLGLAHDAPDPPLPLLPADGQGNVPRQPTLRWTVADGAALYDLEIAADPTFATPVLTATNIITPGFTLHRPLEANTTYYWRVRAHNACGLSATSPPFSFLTAPLPGLCNAGSIPVNVYETGFETDDAGWTHSGLGDTWSLSGDRAHEGSISFHAEDVNMLSNQSLVSPPIMLPTDAAPLALRFWNYQAIDDMAGGCRDGAILEIAADGGDWAQLEAELRTDPYDGPVSDAWSNPLANRLAWCGDPQDWMESIVSLDGYAGQTVRFRYRLGTDVAFGREGWYVDDVRVQACQPAPYAAALTGDSVVDTVANTVITHTFWLKNLGPDDLYEVATVGGGWPTEVVTPLPLSLGYGEQGEVAVRVTVPPMPAFRPLASDLFTLQITSLHDPNLVLTATGTTNVLQMPAFLWSGETAQVGVYHHALTYTLTLTNVGPVTDTLSVAIQGQTWETIADPPTIPLTPGESSQVALIVTVGAGDADDAHVHFNSALAHGTVVNVTLHSSTHLTYFGIFPGR